MLMSHPIALLKHDFALLRHLKYVLHCLNSWRLLLCHVAVILRRLASRHKTSSLVRLICLTQLILLVRR